jgi:hypothetical protein
MNTLWQKLKTYFSKTHTHLKTYHHHYMVCWFWIYGITKMLLLLISFFIGYNVLTMNVPIVDASSLKSHSEIVIQEDFWTKDIVVHNTIKHSYDIWKVKITELGWNTLDNLSDKSLDTPSVKLDQKKMTIFSLRLLNIMTLYQVMFKVKRIVQFLH